jgi:dTDP-4-amino-4,6-dideoxygalactose transaminase
MPVLIDVADDYNMKPELIEQALTPRTRALIPVHLNGRLCDMDAIMGIADEHGLIVIEDAAQSLGATFQSKMAGSFGRTGCFSFYPFKVLGGFGDGGAVTTNDPEIAQSISLLRYNGEDRETGEYHYHGYTGLLDNVQAAVLDVKLRKLPEWLEHRRRVAERYRNGFRGIAGLTVPHYRGEGFRDVYQNYVIRTPHRDALREYLKDRGIETLVHWSTPMWKHRGLKLPEQHLPNTESICREVVSLPMSAETTEDHVDITVDAIIQFFEKRQEERQE